MDKYNYRLLAIAREARGLTQAELSTEVPNLTQGNYSKMEKGLLPITEESLNKIASVLDFPKSFFFYDKPLYNQAEYYYRKRLTIPRKQQIKLEAFFDIFRIWIDGLLMSVEIPEFTLPHIKVKDSNTPEEIAKKIRGIIGLPKGPVDKLVNIIEKRGIMLYFIKNAPEKFDGTTIVTGSGQHIILINDDFPNDRKRFTISHELGHIIMHLPFTPILDEDRDLEEEANKFASEFLMPESEIRRDLINLKFSSLGDLKSFWRSSKAAIIRRALTLRYIDRNKYQYMMIELSRMGERKNEKTEVPLDEPKLIKLIVDTHFDALEYTFEEFSAAILINRNDFDEYFSRQQNNRAKLRIAV